METYKSMLSFKFKNLFILFSLFYLIIINNIQFVNGLCQFNGLEYQEYSKWVNNCNNCTCIESVPFCEKIQCKYEPCEPGKILILNDDQCCPICQEPKKSCHYEGYLINHNSEFSPKICTTCKCKNGKMECYENCQDQSITSDILQNFQETSLNQRQERLRQHNRNLKPRNKSNRTEIRLESSEQLTTNICYYDDKIHQFNSTWSPLKCTQCICGYNSVVDCYVHECPTLNCPNGIEQDPNLCCPKCKQNLMCQDNNGLEHKDGDFWTSKSDPCVHCTCSKGNINCFKQNCTKIVTCAKGDLLVTKSNRCCPQCESQMTQNCDYHGKLYYNGEMWYTNGCQHCACVSGRVICMNVECESKFCLKDEIMVKKKDDCCISCRKPKYCTINDKITIKENEFWLSNSVDLLQKKSSNPCKLCECIQGEIVCYTKSCQNSKYPSFAHLSVYLNEKKQINARTIPFITDFIKSMNKESLIFVVSGPKYSTLYLDEKPIGQFKINDLAQSRVYYKINDDADHKPTNDFVVLAFVSYDNRTVYNVLIEFELFRDGNENLENNQIIKIRKEESLPRSLKHLNLDKNRENKKLVPRKTIFIQPGESIKLTSNELRPKTLPVNVNPDKLIYFLVSARPKYGDLKLKKVFSSDESVPNGWNKVNDLYLEKSIRDFTQNDLDNGNVWYEPFNDECKNDCDFSEAKYDHCMFEVYDQDKLNELLSKEIIHFSIQNEVINETVLGLEVIENQINPLTFSNFDIAGIDSTRDYLIYRIIKNLDKDQGQLEHASNPGVPIETFTQLDLNKGLILYHSPKEIGINPREFFFTFVVTNDNRSDTFPETPFHVKVLPSNDQAPIFLDPVSNINMLQSGSVILPREIFDVEDPDTNLENLVFTIEKSPDNTVIELRSKGQRYVLSKDDSFTIQEIRDGTFRLIHNGAKLDKDDFKISVSDNKHVSIKTISINIKLIDNIAPRTSERATMLMNIKEGQVKNMRRDNMAFIDDHSSPEEIFFKISSQSKLSGRFYNRDKVLSSNSVFTQADIDLQNIRYESPSEIGQNILTDTLVFEVMDKEGNVLKDQVFTIKVEPVNNQAPVVDILQPITVNEGGYLIINESYIHVKDVDSAKEQLNVILDSQPSFGYLENIHKGAKLSSFPLVDLIDGLSIRYVQSDHQNKEPTSDSFIFHVSDGLNESPPHKLAINIQIVNDEKPVAFFEPLQVEYNKLTPIQNSTFYIVDFDSKPEDIELYIEKFPKHGKIFKGNNQLGDENRQFSYSDVLNNQIGYKLEDKLSVKDDILFKLSDGMYTTSAKYVIKRINEKPGPLVEKNEGLQAIEGHIFQITNDMLFTVSKSVDYDRKFEDYLLIENNLIIYHVIKPPDFGKLQLLFDNFYQEIQGPYSFMNTFTQTDIEQGRVFYNHVSNDPTGVTSFTFNVSDSNDNVLSDQRFIITVRGDKLPPVIVHNKGLKVNQGQTTLLTRYELDVKDDDTPLENLKFSIITQPKLGRLENQKEPGRRIDFFTYEDLAYKTIRYVHEDTNNLLKNDLIDFKISDGKNDLSASVYVTITRIDNQMPILKSKFSLKCKELERKPISLNEIQVFDRDTSNDNLKIIITHPPQYGTIEKLVNNIEKKIEDQIVSINTNLNQKLNFILKFNNNQTDKNYVTVNEFSMADIERGLVFYKHRSPGIRQDRFGFIVFDGYNNMFIIDGGIQVSTYQIFNINIDLETNQAPVIDKNLGLNYLYQLDTYTGRVIMKNELSILDKDDADSDIIIEITRKPANGYLQHKDRPGLSINRFTQYDINQNKIVYILKKFDDYTTEDYFEFDVYDLGKNYLKQNRFDIKWSIVTFKEEEVSVMETEGKVRVHIKKTGFLKQFSMVTCKTVSDTAKSNRDSKMFDFVHTNVRVEFNEDESFKACDIIINKDNQIEPIESFYVVLEDAKYALLGSRTKIKINILDKKKESVLEFEKVKYEIQETDKFVSLAVVRSGDLNTDVQVECITVDDSAIGLNDYVPRGSGSYVRIPAGEIYGFCDVEILDDDIKELQTEYFKVYLSSPSEGARLGVKSESLIGIIGPNDVLADDCKTVYQTVSEIDGRILVEITREKINLNETFDVLVQSIPTNEIYTKSFLNTLPENDAKNLSIAEPNIDYENINKKLKFLPGEVTKKIFLKLINPQTEKRKMFTVQIKPLGPSPIINLGSCDYINPDYLNIILGDQTQNGVLVGFNQTSLLVNETSKVVRVPIVRTGDLSKSFSLICHTRQQTAIEGKDYVGRDSFEQSRIHFEPNEKIKMCNVEIINDQVFEADETFQIKLSDLRSSSSDVKFNPFTTMTVTILNNEDSSVISFSEEVYYTEEPSSNDSSIIKSITILRTGDLSRTSMVRVSTVDETAKAGLDYKPKTEIIKFLPGVSALDFEIEILYDYERESSESFKVALGPQDPVSAVFGKIKVATVLIKDNFGNATNQSEKHENSPIYLNSLVYHVLEQLGDTSTVPVGEPLICLEPCDSRNPKNSNNRKLCDVIDRKRLKTSYSWEISTPNEYGIYSQFIKMTQNSIFTNVNESILEPIYFQNKFRIRCVIEYSRDNSRTLKSNYVQVNDKTEFLNKLKNTDKCSQKWSDLSKSQNFTNSELQSSFNYYSKIDSNLPLVNFKFDKPFIARADYVSAEFIKNNPTLVDVDYLNFVRLNIEIPYIDGILPLVSTMPLHNHRHLLNDEFNFYPNHICSNFFDENDFLKHGFVREFDEDEIDNKWIEINEKIDSFRNKKTLKFYSSLDKEKCVWKFVGYFDLTELTSYCHAQIISSDLSDEQTNKNYLSIKVPIYVSYLYPNQQVQWSSVDYKINVEAPIIYKTKELYDEFVSADSLIQFSKNLIDEQEQVEKSLMSLTVTKISMTENGKLIIEFSTIPSFHGQFIKSHHTGQESSIIAPNGLNIKFNLELVWSQYTYDYPEQTWKATSDTVLNNYSGNYTIRLVPCYARPSQPFKYPFDCEPKEPINYTIPITVEQSNMPVPVKYSLGTRFTLSNNLLNSINPSTNSKTFDGYFRHSDTIYGTVIWDDQDQKSVYKLELDKVYICSSYSDFVPVYDPEGNIYNKGSQHGCAKPHNSLKHRILLLDKNTTHTRSKFEAQFLNEFLNSSNSSRFINSEKLKRHLVMDGFKFNANILYEIENLTKKFDSQDMVWYVQTIFYIRAGNNKHTRQVQSNFYSLKNVFNNGTNMNLIRLTSDKKQSSLLTSKIKGSKSKEVKPIHIKPVYENIVLKTIVPIVLFLIVTLLVTVTLIYYKKENLEKFFNAKRNENGTKNFDILSLAKKKFGKNLDLKKDTDNGSNSTNDTIVVSPLLDSKSKKEETANSTFQTSVSKSSYQNTSHIDEDDEDHYGHKHSVNSTKSCESKFKSLLKNVFINKKSKNEKCLKMSTSGDYEDLTRNFLDTSIQTYPRYPTITRRNNYLYFNYNNNKMNYFNSDGIEIETESVKDETNKFNGGGGGVTETMVAITSMSSSSPAQITPVNSTTKCTLSTNAKRLSGTEV